MTKLILSSNSSNAVSHTQRSIENLNNANPRQRSHAAQELGQQRDVAAVPHLITLLRDDPNTYVRSAVAEALGHIGDTTAVYPLMDALHDPCTFVRRAAVISLGQLQAKEAQGALLQTLDDPNFYVRRAAINAIGKLEVRDMGAVLLPLLNTPDPRIRRTVITAMRRLNYQEATPHLIDLLDTYVVNPTPRDLPIVKILVMALADLRARAAIPTLIRVIQGYVGGRSLAALALGKIGDPQAGPVLLEALADKSLNLQIAALKSLGMLQYTPAAPTVREFLTITDPRLRRQAALTLGQLRDTQAIPTLLEIAREDVSSLVRPAAVEALGLVGNPQVLPALLPLVNDANAYLRAALVGALVNLDGNRPQVKSALEQLAQDKVEHVATTARCALEVYKTAEAPVDTAVPTKPQTWLRKLLGRARATLS
ncbi:MAG TPA: HEAT repeat domain-containing protein [Anaerolineae bacterium]|nr:HEAT repeat domain-containing protein [Anaerolineae bacterium]